MTAPAFLPNGILKSLVCTECGGAVDLGRIGTVEDLDKLQEQHYTLEKQPDWRSRVLPLEEVPAGDRKDLGYVPWFLACQPQRFPYWFGEKDARNKDLWQVLQSLENNKVYLE